MKCQNCGYESKNLLYCPVCGEKIDISKQEKVEEIKEDDPFENYEKKEEVTSSSYGPQYKVFAIVGYVIGIFSIVFCWVPFIFFWTASGLVFSKIGDRPTNKQEFAKKGFTFSLIGVIINVLFTITFFVVMSILISEGIIKAVD